MDHAFWGALLTADSPVFLSPTFDLKISNACIISGQAPEAKTFIKLCFREAADSVQLEKDTSEVILCALSLGKVEHAVLDIILPAGAKCEISCVGPSHVSLSGNYLCYKATVARLDQVIEQSRQSNQAIHKLEDSLSERLKAVLETLPSLVQGSVNAGDTGPQPTPKSGKSASNSSPTKTTATKRRGSTRRASTNDSFTSTGSIDTSTSSTASGERTSARLAGLKRRNEDSAEAKGHANSSKRSKTNSKQVGTGNPDLDTTLMPPPPPPASTSTQHPVAVPQLGLAPATVNDTSLMTTGSNPTGNLPPLNHSAHNGGTLPTPPPTQFNYRIKDKQIGDGLAAKAGSRVDFEYYLRTTENQWIEPPQPGSPWVPKAAVLGEGHVRQELEMALTGMRDGGGYRQVYFPLSKEEYGLPIGTILLYDVRIKRITV